MRAFLLAAVLLLPLAASAQPMPEAELEAPAHFGPGAGMTVLLTNSGFGLGGYFRTPVSEVVALTAELGLGAVKDASEHRIFSNTYRSRIPSKANYLLVLPVHIGAQRRLFRTQIRDNFRPYAQLGVGPAFGWVWPYFDDTDGDGVLDADERTYDAFSSLGQGEARLGWSATLALGAFFGESRRTAQSIRFGYTLMHFPRSIELTQATTGAGTEHWFGTPTVTLLFGRMW